jgi:hypothetical protein
VNQLVLSVRSQCNLLESISNSSPNLLCSHHYQLHQGAPGSQCRTMCSQEEWIPSICLRCQALNQSILASMYCSPSNYSRDSISICLRPHSINQLQTQSALPGTSPLSSIRRAEIQLHCVLPQYQSLPFAYSPSTHACGEVLHSEEPAS